ncbi:hypothetical protein FGB62_219g021 [Gracilaria domingensis]|nr:hypothetical protein FGB62_219g021 [Gracilaria domingensis]
MVETGDVWVAEADLQGDLSPNGFSELGAGDDFDGDVVGDGGVRAVVLRGMRGGSGGVHNAGVVESLVRGVGAGDGRMFEFGWVGRRGGERAEADAARKKQLINGGTAAAAAAAAAAGRQCAKRARRWVHERGMACGGMGVTPLAARQNVFSACVRRARAALCA